MAASTVVTMQRRTPDRAPHLSHSAEQAAMCRRRRISTEAGRGLEILGHAIEYLADEYMYEGGQINLADPRVQAVLLLMEKNRDIYFACPEVPTLGERLRSWLQLLAA